MHHYDGMAQLAQDRIEELTRAAQHRGPARQGTSQPVRRWRRRWSG